MNKISLKQIMDSLYQNACADPGQIKSCTLSKGLEIYLKLDNGFIKLFLARTDVYPSIEEYKTVIRSLPSAPMILPPKKINSKDINLLKKQRYFLLAKWPKQEQIPMGGQNA